MAHSNGEASRKETKRKFDEEPRNWGGSKAGVPAAPVPSCSNVRPRLTVTTQPVEDPVNCSNLKDDSFKWLNDEPTEETLPLRRDPPLYHGGGSCQPIESDLPNVKASAGGAAVYEAVNFGEAFCRFDVSEDVARLLGQGLTMKVKVKSVNRGELFHVKGKLVLGCRRIDLS